MSKEINALNHRISNIEKRLHRLESGSCAPREQNEKSGSQENAPADKHNATDGQVLLPTQVPPTPSNTDQSKNRRYKTLEWWKTLFEVIGIPFAIGYAVVTYCQWRDLRHNFAVDQRAWVRLEYTILPDLSEDSHLSGWPITMKNLGKSPAIGIETHVVFEIVKNTNAPSFNFGPPHGKDYRATMFPGDGPDEMPVDNEPGPLGETKELTREQIKSLIDGKTYLSVFAQVTYRDQFGEHWQQFCTWKAFGKTGSFSAKACIDWNKIGDGAPPYKEPHN